VVKLILGLVKGLVIGAAVGYGAFALDLDGGFHWVTYGAIGGLVGLLVGRPIWSHLIDKESTTWVSILKAAVGFGIGCGVFALVDRVWGGFALEVGFLAEGTRAFQDWQPIFGGALGAVYGAFVELDDSFDDSKAKAKAAKKKLPAGKPGEG
jgi:hypothetical protein